MKTTTPQTFSRADIIHGTGWAADARFTLAPQETPQGESLSPVRVDRLSLVYDEDKSADMDLLEPTLYLQAVADVSYTVRPAHGDRRIERLTSGGLGGIDPQSSARYFHAIESEELDELRDHLAHFGITTPDEEWKRLVDERRLHGRLLVGEELSRR